MKAFIVFLLACIFFGCLIGYCFPHEMSTLESIVCGALSGFVTAFIAAGLGSQ